jgi:cold shock CspA family protein
MKTAAGTPCPRVEQTCSLPRLDSNVAVKHDARHKPTNLHTTNQPTESRFLMTVKKSGVIKMVGPNFGFATSDDDSGDCFLPRSVILESGLVLDKGDHITYSAVPTPRGMRATSISLAT